MTRKIVKCFHGAHNLGLEPRVSRDVCDCAMGASFAMTARLINVTCDRCICLHRVDQGTHFGKHVLCVCGVVCVCGECHGVSNGRVK